MYRYNLLDGSHREFESQITAAELAKSISDSLFKKTIAVKIDGHLSDLSDLLPNDSKIELITK